MKIFKDLNREDFKEWIGTYVITFTFIYFMLVTFIDIPKSGQRFADIILGALISTCLMTVLNFFFDKAKPKNDEKDVPKN